MLANLIRKHGQNLLGEPVHRTTEGQLAMRDALARAKLELQAGMQLVIDRNNNDICELLAIIDARSAALKRMQRAVRAPTPVSDSQQQQLSTLQASLDEVRRKRDVAVGENNRLLRKLRELQVEVDGLKQLSLKQLSSSVDRAFASATPASCATTRSGIGAVASTSDARRYAEEQADADAHLKEMEALARKREGELQRMRKDVASKAPALTGKSPAPDTKKVAKRTVSAAPKGKSTTPSTKSSQKIKDIKPASKASDKKPKAPQASETGKMKVSTSASKGKVEKTPAKAKVAPAKSKAVKASTEKSLKSEAPATKTGKKESSGKLPKSERGFP